MERTYRPVDRYQEFLLPPNVIDWVGEDHLVYSVIEAVRRLDAAPFHRLAKLGGVGRSGYDPDMVLTVFVYAMVHGVPSSRRFERLFGMDVASPGHLRPGRSGSHGAGPVPQELSGRAGRVADRVAGAGRRTGHGLSGNGSAGRHQDHL